MLLTKERYTVIDRTIPRLGYQTGYSKSHMFEAFAFTYLTRYNNADPPTRVLNSLVRAYDPTSIDIIPRVDGGRPAFTIVNWVGGGNNRILVAIEGTTSLAQYAPLMHAGSGATSSWGNGYIYQPFLTHANAIYTALMDHSNFRNNFDNRCEQIIFAGFSMGAALAHILCSRFWSQHPTKQYKANKFGCPRIGNANYMNTRPRGNDRMDWYVEGDGVHCIPFLTGRDASDLTTTLERPFLSYAPNSPSRVWSNRGEFAGSLTPRDAIDAAQVGVNLLRPLNEGNSWSYHHWDLYRLALSYLAVGESPADEARFVYLEYEDDNAWGQGLPRAGGNYVPLKVMADPAPAPFVVGFTQPVQAEIVRAAAPLARPQAPMSNGGGTVVVESAPQNAWRNRTPRTR